MSPGACRLKRTSWIAAGLAAALALSGGCAADPSSPSGNRSRPTPGVNGPSGQSANSRSQTGQAGGDAVVARVGTLNITNTQLLTPLVRAHGLGMLQNLLQLEMAREDARAAGLTVSPAEVQAETDRTLEQMFKDQNVDKDQYPLLLSQFLQRKNLSVVEWEMLMESNATLRKLAEPLATKAIKDAMLTEAFNQLYGEKVQVRHIQCTNLQEIAQARQRLTGGEPFESVARAVSRNARTASLGGELAPFTRQSPYPQAFKDAAFGLKNKGDISDPVQADGSYHLIYLEQRIPPKVIKFEDVKESVRADLQEKLVQQLMKERREEMSDRARRTMQVLDPTLKAQYDLESQRREAQIREREQIRRELERDRQKAVTEQIVPDQPLAPATLPATTQGTR